VNALFLPALVCISPFLLGQGRGNKIIDRESANEPREPKSRQDPFQPATLNIGVKMLI